MVHYNQTDRVLEQRQQALDAVLFIHPERFVRSAPRPPAVPTEAWMTTKPVQLMESPPNSRVSMCLKVVDTRRVLREVSERKTALFRPSKLPLLSILYSGVSWCLLPGVFSSPLPKPCADQVCRQLTGADTCVNTTRPYEEWFGVLTAIGCT